MSTTKFALEEACAGIRQSGVTPEVSDVTLGDNQWVRPVYELAPNETNLERQLKSNPRVGNVNFEKKGWSVSRAVTDNVLELLLKVMKEDAQNRFEGLKLEKYIRKGSSREGLKTRAPDEYDVLLQYHLEGLKFQPTSCKSGDAYVIEFGEIEVLNTMADLQSRYPSLDRLNAFVQRGEKLLLSSEVLHEKVFKSLIDSACSKVVTAITQKGERNVPFSITRKMNPPSVNITIKDACTVPEIDVDIVPGLRVRIDKVQGHDYPSHFIFRWRTVEQNTRSGMQFANPGELWRFSSTGFEAAMFDVSRSKTEGKYVMTAMRILKTYLSRTKEEKAFGPAPPPIATVLVSFHLKNIALYCLKYLELNDIRVENVRQAIGYMVDLLEVSLEEKKLPHFFRRNEMLRGMFPEYTYDPKSLAFNLFGTKAQEALSQALLSLQGDLRKDLQGIIVNPSDRMSIREQFRRYIRDREYYQGAVAYGFMVDLRLSS